METHTICSYLFAKNDHQQIDRNYGVGELLSEPSMPRYFCEALVCRFCGKELDVVGYKSQPIYLCSFCGWWHFAAKIDQRLYVDYFFVKGIAKRYDISSIEIPLEDLRRYLANHPNHAAFTHYTRFEQLMRECLRSAYPGSEVHHVGGTGDGGIDIKLVMASGNTYLVQVKRRQDPRKKEGVQAVRELNGVLFREHEAKGMIITSANEFTTGTATEIMKTKEKHPEYEMILVALPGIVSMLKLQGKDPYEPWIPIVDEIFRKTGTTTDR